MASTAATQGTTNSVSKLFQIRLQPKEYKLRADASPDDIRDWARSFDSLFGSTSAGRELSDVIRSALGEQRRIKINPENDHLSEYIRDETKQKFRDLPTEQGNDFRKMMDEMIAAIQVKDCGTYIQTVKLFDRLASFTQVIGIIAEEMAPTNEKNKHKFLVKTAKPDGTNALPDLADGLQEFEKVNKKEPCDSTQGLKFKDISDEAAQLDTEFFNQIFTQIPIEFQGVKDIMESFRERGISSGLAVILEALKRFGPEKLYSQAQAIRQLQAVHSKDDKLESKLTQAITGIFRQEAGVQASVLVKLYHVFQPESHPREHEMVRKFEIAHKSGFILEDVLQLLHGDDKEPGVFTMREEQLKLLYQRKPKSTSTAKVHSTREESEKSNRKKQQGGHSGGTGQPKNPAGCSECSSKEHKKWWHKDGKFLCKKMQHLKPRSDKGQGNSHTSSSSVTDKDKEYKGTPTSATSFSSLLERVSSAQGKKTGTKVKSIQVVMEEKPSDKNQVKQNAVAMVRCIAKAGIDSDT